MLRTVTIDGPMFFMSLCEMVLIVSFMPEKQKRKSRLCFQLLLAAAIFITVNIINYFVVDSSNASTALQAPLCFTATLVCAVCGMGMNGKTAVYCTVWSYLLTEVTVQSVMPIIGGMRISSQIISIAVSYMLYMCAAVCMYCFVKKWLSVKLQYDHHYHVGRQKMLAVVLAAMAYTVLANYQFIFWLLGYEPESQSNMIAVFRLIAGVGCLIFLYMQNSIEKRQAAERELDMLQQLWYRQQEQLRISQENIDLINRKCHDLKYQMAALRKLGEGREINAQLKEMEQAVMIYDSAMKTGNPVLDTVLTEKSLYCEANHINMTCMADGKKLDFVGKVDLYTMFGNALDNAIESVMHQTYVDKRVIQVSVFHEKRLVMIRVKNYCENKPVFKDGFPVSEKEEKGYHGFGLKSIRYTAEKYGGGVVCQAADHYFVLQILLPIPEGTG